MCKKSIAITFSIFIFILALGEVQSDKNIQNQSVRTKKYVAFSADTEAYFTPVDFEQNQGEFTQDIINVCEKYDIPFTWLIIVDKEQIEVKAIAEKHYPARKHKDEFSLHTHFKWFIMDYSDDFSSFKDIDRRMKWLNHAKDAIVKAGLPMPQTFRYGGGDTNDNYYCIEDLVYLIDELGIKNFLFSDDRLREVIGINDIKHLYNNVWEIEGGRQVTLLSTCVYLDNEQQIVINKINERLNTSDYAIIGCHDYRRNVPDNLQKAILHLNEEYDVEYVTIAQIGEMVRKGKINNLK